MDRACGENEVYTVSEYTTASCTVQNVLDKLNKHIKEYSKNKGYFLLLESNTDVVIENAKKLEDFHVHTNHCQRNPYTEIYKILHNLKNT